MDPSATFRMLIATLQARNWRRAQEHADALMEWLKRGGSAPTQPGSMLLNYVGQGPAKLQRTLPLLRLRLATLQGREYGSAGRGRSLTGALRGFFSSSPGVRDGYVLVKRQRWLNKDGSITCAYTVWEPSAVTGRHSSITSEDGRWWGQVGTAALPPEVERIPPGPTRSAVLAELERRNLARVLKATARVFPEAANNAIKTTGMRGELSLSPCRGVPKPEYKHVADTDTVWLYEE